MFKTRVDGAKEVRFRDWFGPIIIRTEVHSRTNVGILVLGREENERNGDGLYVSTECKARSAAMTPAGRKPHHCPSEIDKCRCSRCAGLGARPRVAPSLLEATNGRFAQSCDGPVTEFGGDDPIIAALLNGLAYQRFRSVIPIAFSRIDQVDTELLGSPP